MTKDLIYIADDEINICNIIKSFLLKEGYEVEIFTNGRAILEAFHQRPAAMLIIDIMMPEIDGYSLCAAIRKISDVPIIILSAKDSEPDKIAGLTLGSDDYLTKPFSPMELMARIQSIFRRTKAGKEPTKVHPGITIGDLTIFPNTKHAEFQKKDLNLTITEFNLLSYLITNKERAVSREELLDKIWGFASEVETRATDDMIKRIRKKITQAGSTLKIETVWGFGFKITAKETSHEKKNH